VIPIAALQSMLFVFAALAGISAWIVYLWAVRDGQFKDVEEPAERLLSQDAKD
jgi:cbb3-type cytochrome oxidase maturation protein